MYIMAQNVELPAPSPQDVSLAFVVDGFVSEDEARMLATLEFEQRAEIAEQLQSLTDVPEHEGTSVRLSWLTRQLAKPVVDQVVFVDYTSEKRRINRATGLSTRVFTHGRHSSGYTYVSSVGYPGIG